MTLKMEKKMQKKSIMRGSNYDYQHHRQLLPHNSEHLRKRSSILKRKYFSVISSIKKSIKKCHCRLIEFFSKLEGARRRGKGFVILHREEADDVDLPNILALREENGTRLLPPLASYKTRTIVLDLDETLVHSCPDPPPKTYDFMIKPSIYGLRMNFYVLKRPGVDEFLEAISKKYEVVVFTAGLEPYASLLLDILDPKGLISHRLYRDSCKQLGQGRFIKDLSKIGRDLKQVVIVDDNPKSYTLQPANAIPIKRFEDDIKDRELKKLMVFFERNLDGFKDMRDAVKKYLDGNDRMRQPSSL
ncbi:hypothetical protein ES332_D06G176400v1 [Gossypium tomentosum]|uniref:FCP1 homology domain-containing protein n=1 Tax=Gossypium tomentosum TaxID=34277 RepID=A0A5D2KKD1_GOSTO|nr:hypothetical protein ES332_D06G176400v1 [Gossypium tomentosum]